MGLETRNFAMTHSLADQFIQALRTLEETGSPDALCALYADNAAVGNLLAPDKFAGPEGARQFWTEYRGTFRAVRSEFRAVIASDQAAALEWTTVGTAYDGASLRYEGVTILEATDGKLSRSCAYFNPAQLGRQMEHAP